MKQKEELTPKTYVRSNVERGMEKTKNIVDPELWTSIKKR